MKKVDWKKVDWKKCVHKWGKWNYAAGYGDESIWRFCSKCKAEQEGVSGFVPTKNIYAPRKERYSK